MSRPPFMQVLGMWVAKRRSHKRVDVTRTLRCSHSERAVTSYSTGRAAQEYGLPTGVHQHASPPSCWISDSALCPCLSRSLLILSFQIQPGGRMQDSLSLRSSFRAREGQGFGPSSDFRPDLQARCMPTPQLQGWEWHLCHQHLLTPPSHAGSRAVDILQWVFSECWPGPVGGQD